MRKNNYIEKLKDPRWQKKRLEILERDGWKCSWCGEKEQTLHVHHLWYETGKEPWEVSDDSLVTLCQYCHEDETENRGEQEQKLLRSFRELKWNHWDIYNLQIAIDAKVITQEKIHELYETFIKICIEKKAKENSNG